MSFDKVKFPNVCRLKLVWSMCLAAFVSTVQLCFIWMFGCRTLLLSIEFIDFEKIFGKYKVKIIITKTIHLVRRRQRLICHPHSLLLFHLLLKETIPFNNIEVTIKWFIWYFFKQHWYMIKTYLNVTTFPSSLFVIISFLWIYCLKKQFHFIM